MKKMRMLSLLLSLVMVLGICPCHVSATEGTRKPHIFIIGDSMAANYKATATPKMGWGQAMPYFFTDDVVIDNRAVSGTSSKSFYNVYWTDLIADMQEGDYLLLTFGANDSKGKDTESEEDEGADTSTDVLLDRYTNPEGASTEEGSFKWYLSKYIAETQSKGATPILITPPERRDNRSLSNYQFAVYTMEAYSEAIRELADEINNDTEPANDVICLEGSLTSIELYRSLGDLAEGGSKKLFNHVTAEQYPTNWPEGAADSTHFRDFGAVEIAGIIVEELIQKGSDLTQYLKTVSAPVFYNADHNTDSLFMKTDAKVKGTTLYPRAQFINKDNAPTTVQVVMAGYDSDGKLTEIISKDEFTAPAKSVTSFDTEYTMPSYVHAGKIKMFVWKDFESLVPAGSDVNEWKFSEAANSGNLVFEATFDDSATGTAVNGLDSWEVNVTGTATETDVTIESLTDGGSRGALIPATDATSSYSVRSVKFDPVTIGPEADANMETVIECDMFWGKWTYLALVSNSRTVFQVYTGGGGSLMHYGYKPAKDDNGNEIDSPTSNDESQSISDVADAHVHFKAVINERERTADVYINGTQISDDAYIYGFRYATSNRFYDRIQISTSGSRESTQSHVDNISVYRRQIGTAQ